MHSACSHKALLPVHWVELFNEQLVCPHFLAFNGIPANVLVSYACKPSIAGMSDLGFGIISRRTWWFKWPLTLIHSLSQGDLSWYDNSGTAGLTGSCCTSVTCASIRGHRNKRAILLSLHPVTISLPSEVKLDRCCICKQNFGGKTTARPSDQASLEGYKKKVVESQVNSE